MKNKITIDTNKFDNLNETQLIIINKFYIEYQERNYTTYNKQKMKELTTVFKNFITVTKSDFFDNCFCNQSSIDSYAKIYFDILDNYNKNTEE